MHTHQDAGKRNKTYMIVFIVSIIFLVSFSIRALYLNALITNDNTFSFANGSDSSQYIHLAENIVYLGRYSQDSMESRHIALLRTPGFPFFYAVFEYFGLAPKYVLYAHVIIGSLIPVLASLFIFLITKNILTTLVTGLLCGFSASGILMTG